MAPSQTVTLIAQKAQRYAGRPVRVGERFHATRRDARVLLYLKRATYATAVVVPEPLPVSVPIVEPTFQPVSPAFDEPSEPSDDLLTTKRRSRRRDHQAEE